MKSVVRLWGVLLVTWMMLALITYRGMVFANAHNSVMAGTCQVSVSMDDKAKPLCSEPPLESGSVLRLLVAFLIEPAPHWRADDPPPMLP